MIKRKGIMLIGCALLTLGLASCAGTEIDPIPTPNPDQNTGQNNDDDFSVSHPEVTEAVYSLVGAKFANWKPEESIKDQKCLFTKTGNYYTITTTVEVGDEFKLVQGGTWNDQYGVEDMDWDLSTAGIVKGTKEDYKEGKGNRSNFKMEKAGELTVKLNPYYFINKESNNVIIMTLK